MYSQHDDLEELFWGSKASPEKGISKKSDQESGSWATMMLVMIAFALSCLSGFAAARVLYYQPAIGMDLFSKTPAGASSSTEKVNNNITVLLLGTDERNGEEQARSDTIILAFIDAKTSKISILSLPRDTYVKIPGVKKNTKLNHAHAIGGAKLTAQTLQDFLGINIDYYLETNFDGFAKAIDALGGIDLVVEKHMYYPSEGIDLQEGLQHLNGRKALQYVRYRSDGQGDIGRIARQQKFLQAVAEKVLMPQTITKLPTLVKALSEAVKTDMEYSTMLTVANIARSADNKSILTQTLPGEPTYISGVSYWNTDMDKTKSILQEMNVTLVTERERKKWQ